MKRVYTVLWGEGKIFIIYFLSYWPTPTWAVKIVTGVPEAIPLVGSFIVELLRGSVSVGQSTLTRFYSLHSVSR